ncbi:DUF2680 domain-containing protein [bacterium]|nr:DUF2680 domain-containing protein [bacterium]
MTRMRKTLLLTGAIVLLVGAMSVTAFASSNYNSPAEAAAGVTGKTVEEVIAERQETGKTYGVIANEAGKLEEFKSEILEMKKDAIEQKVADGTLTREQADEIINAIEENSANCDGTGSARIGQKYNAGFGTGSENCTNGNCTGNNKGSGNQGTKGSGMQNKNGNRTGNCRK